MDIVRSRLSDQLVKHLARAIVRGQLRPRDPLPGEPALALEFKISKPVVRESVQVLASLGLVSVKQGKRTVVLEESEWNVLDPVVQEAFQFEGRGGELAQQFYELRLILETSAAARAAARATEAQLAEFGLMVEEMQRIASGSRDMDAFLRVDRSFHDAIARGSGNEVFRQVVRNVHNFLSNTWSSERIPVGDIDVLVELHVRIADALIARSSTEAGMAMETHIRRAMERELGLDLTVLANGAMKETAV